MTYHSIIDKYIVYLPGTGPVSAPTATAGWIWSTQIGWTCWLPWSASSWNYSSVIIHTHFNYNYDPTVGLKIDLWIWSLHWHTTASWFLPSKSMVEIVDLCDKHTSNLCNLLNTYNYIVLMTCEHTCNCDMHFIIIVSTCFGACPLYRRAETILWTRFMFLFLWRSKIAAHIPMTEESSTAYDVRGLFEVVLFFFCTHSFKIL